MISWMQKHRKYLVVTIWVSTIAFVGAGFVGWGSYEFGSGGSSVAKVGDIKIEKTSFKTAYSNIYGYYNKLFDGKLDQKQAKAMGLENMALQTLVNQALIENFARDIGLEVGEDEVAAKIVSMEVFWVNGRFEKNAYLAVLKAENIKKKEFEEGIRKDLLSQKIADILKVKTVPMEASALAAAMLSSDKIQIKLLNASQMKTNLSESQVQAFWETNKAGFKTEPAFDLEIVWVDTKTVATPSDEEIKAEFNQNGSQYKSPDSNNSTLEQLSPKIAEALKIQTAKKEALKKFLELKNGTLAGQKLSHVNSKAGLLTPEALVEIAKLKDGETARPILQPKGYAVVKMGKGYPSVQMSYDEAKSSAKAQLTAQTAAQMLKQQAVNELASFKGTDLGFVSRTDADKLTGITKEEANKALKAIFESKINRLSVEISAEKILLVQILEQKLFDEEQMKAKKEMIDERLTAIKSGLVNQNTIEWLRQKYEVKLY